MLRPSVTSRPARASLSASGNSSLGGMRLGCSPASWPLPSGRASSPPVRESKTGAIYQRYTRGTPEIYQRSPDTGAVSTGATSYHPAGIPLPPPRLDHTSSALPVSSRLQRPAGPLPHPSTTPSIHQSTHCVPFSPRPVPSPARGHSWPQQRTRANLPPNRTPPPSADCCGLESPMPLGFEQAV